MKHIEPIDVARVHKRQVAHALGHSFPRSAINRRTHSAFSESDNGSEAISPNAAENESDLIDRDSDALKSEASALLETTGSPPLTTARSEASP